MNLTNVGHTLRLREYYYMLLRHKVAFFMIICLCLIVATTMAFTMPKVYRAETVLLVEGESILNPLISGLAITPSAFARLRTLREELLSWQRITLLVEKLELDKNITSPIEYERLINKIRASISIQMRGGDLIIISYEGPNPKKNQQIVKTLADIIIEGNITSVDMEANSAINFIEEQLSDYRSNLEGSEERLREFREMYSSVLPIATRMNEQLVQLKIELSNLLVDNTEAHPRVIQTRQLIKQIESQRDEFMAQAQAQGVAIDPEDYAQLVSSVPLQQQQLAKLQRDYFVNEGIYQQLRSRLETAKISQTLEKSESGPKFRILEPARLPLEPVKPNKPLFIIGGLICGICLGTLAVYLLEMNNNSIRNVDEARELLELPVLGTISTIRIDDLVLEERLKVANV